MGNSSSSTQVPPPRFVLATPTLARFEGVLLGMAIGDFVGAFVEGNSPAESAAAVDRVARCVREQVRTFPDSQSVVREDVLWGRIRPLVRPSLHASYFLSAPLIIQYFLFGQCFPLSHLQSVLPLHRNPAHALPPPVLDSATNDALRLAFAAFDGHFRFGQITDDTQLAREVTLAAAASMSAPGSDPVIDTQVRTRCDSATLVAYVHLFWVSSPGFGLYMICSLIHCTLCLHACEFRIVFSIQRVADRFAALYARHAMVGCGPTTCMALTKLIKGIPLHQAGGAGYGNSPTARAVPLGVVYAMAVMLGPLGGCDPLSERASAHATTVPAASAAAIADSALDPAGPNADISVAASSTLALEPTLARRLVDACVAIARITHTNRSCSDMAIVFAIAVAVVIRLDAAASEWAPIALLDQLIALSRPLVQPTTLEHLAVLSGCLDASPGEAADTLAFIGYPTVPADERARGGINGDAVSSTLWALWCFLRHPRDLLACVQATVRAGGDTDSTAAFACALVGYVCVCMCMCLSFAVANVESHYKRSNVMRVFSSWCYCFALSIPVLGI